MLDELLGRAELKARIDELEDQCERLENQLEAEQRRRSDAVSDRQDAQERVNRLEDRIADLEGRLDRVGGDEADLAFRRTDTVRGDRLSELLDRLESYETGPEGALTAAVTADDAADVPETVRDAFGGRAPLVAQAAPCVAVTDDAGLVSTALAPPDPPGAFASWGDGFDLDRSWFLPTGRFAFALVRADRFALAEYDGRERLGIEGFETDVKSKHSKGGFSQARFERLRDEQVAEHLDECRERLEAREAERLYLAGDRAAIRELDVEYAAATASDASGDPKEALGEAFHDFWTTRLYLI